VLGYHRIVLFEAPLHPPAPPPRAGLPLEFAFLDRGDRDECARFRPDVPRGEFELRLGHGERCFAARSAAEIVSASWVHRNTVYLEALGYEIVVPEGALYVCDVFTAPHVRGLRVAPAVSRELKNRLGAEGFERWVSFVLGGNVVALKNAKRNGSRETGRRATLKLGRLPPLRVPYLPPRRSK
jgi:ribosomal protein S18 acetylase RimI-like enzyme